MSKQYGHYIEGSSDFCITERDIPRNWYNYLWNDNYITFTSQTSAGESFMQDDLGRRIKLVRERGFFAIEGDDSFGIGGLPVNEKLDSYRCVHSRGESVIYTEKNGIAAEVGIIVPRELNAELWRVSLENKSDRTRTLSAVAFCDSLIDAGYGRQGYNTEASHFDEELGALYIVKKKTMWGKGYGAHGFMSSSDKCDGFSGAYNAIIGPYGSFAHPVIVEKGGCNNSIGCGEKLAFAMQKNMTLSPGEKKEVVFMLGIALSFDEMKDMVKKNTLEFYYEESAAVKAKLAAETDMVKINTPDGMLNNMFEWLKLQSYLGSRWARVRHNGYRDMTSDTDCLAAINPELALERFKRILSYQYSNGYAPRTFIDGEIKPNNFSDNTVWLTFTASSIIKELGQKEILDIEVPYNDGTVGTIYEHLYRSVDYLYNFKGLHGLVKIWGGDWNDCMDKAGLEGKGVSVWLSIAWYRANKFFAELAEMYGRPEDVKLANERGEEMRALIEEYGWDGEYYIDAINDKGVKIGSKECEEGKIFLIPQIWAVFSGVSREGREITAMDSVEKYLSDPLGTVISYPPYTKWDGGVGSVTNKHAGIHENGGVYLHTIAWKIAADAMLKRADKVEAGIETILPFRNKVVDGRAEPYIMCNSYFGKQTGYRYGTPGQSWRTAAGQWFEKALVNYVFGLLPEMEGLRIDPCLPPSWKEASIDKRFRGANYHIRYENGGTRVKKILVEGKEIEGNILPLVKGDADVIVITE
ncbi:MAG: hypothetical protein E7673_06115 [Ruminococcaceae bacterium]|nr:hypothetical protein [Oscillospiraceae bacterium]